jgi:two-component system sensor histidine kinase/response regulator
MSGSQTSTSAAPDDTGQNKPSLALVILATAAAYYLTGRLGLALAIPPGYATIIWPPAGIALAATALAGYRVWPGVALGSFLINLGLDLQVDSSSHLIVSSALAAAIAGAAALQAVVGAWLLRRTNAFPFAPIEATSVARLFLFGGVIASLVNSTLANLVLLTFGRMTIGEAPLNWATWWSGDAIGVFVLAPAIMVVARAPRGERRRSVAPIAAAMAAALAATVGLFALNEHAAQRNLMAQLDDLTQDFASHISATLRLGESAVGGLAGVFESTTQRSRGDFDDVAKRLVAFTPGVQSIEWIPAVANGDKLAVEQKMTAEWGRAFSIFERDHGNQVSASGRSVYFPVAYVYPVEGNEGAIGFDLGSSPQRAASLIQAQKSGKPVATAAINLVQNGKTGILLFVPVYDQSAGGVNALKGLSLGVFAVPDLLSVALQGRDIADLDYCLADATEPNATTALTADSSTTFDACVQGRGRLVQARSDMVSQARIDFAGRNWTLWVAPRPAYFARHSDYTAYFVLLGGFLLAAFVSGFVLVVTDRQRQLIAAREKALEDQKFALDQHAIVSITDPKGVILYANDRFCAVAGYQREQLIGARHTIVNSGHHDREFYQRLWSTILSGKVWRGELCNRNSGGQLYWLHSTVVPLIERDGTVAQFIAICTDITARKHLEHDLEESRAFLQSVSNSMGEGVYTLDAEGRCTFLNAEGERLIGWSLAEIKGRSLHDLIHFQDGSGRKIAACDCEIMNTVRAGGNLRSEDQCFTHRDGRVFPVSIVAMPLGEAGGAVGSVTVFQDITERRRIEEALRRSEARLSIALSASSTGLWDYYPADDHAVYSDTWFAMLGYAPGELPSTGETFVSLVHPDDLKTYGVALAAHTENGRETIDVELRMRRKDGEWAWIKTVGSVTERDAAGNSTRLIGIHIDVSEAHRAQDELATAKDDAVRANKAKGNFLATMSHEIRTPMNAIIGLSHLLGRTQLTPRQSDYLDKLQTASHGLLAIINDILDFSKIEAGKLSIESVAFDIDDLLRNVTAVIAPKTREKGLELVVACDPAAPQRLVSDPLRLSQILTNLLSNAAKFTEAGEVVLRIGSRPLDEGRVTLEFEVTDTGIGMSADQIAALFRPFAQADASISRRFGGTGLGLAITSEFANLLGGQIEVESQPGAGSVFRFSAPVAVEAQPGVDRTESSIVGKNVLIVDDCAAAREAAGAIIRHAGAAAEAMASGAEALQRLKVGAQFDFILLDHKMPGMDGVETLRRLRAASVCTPVVIAAASGRDTLRRALDAEFAAGDAPIGILEKPIAAVALRAMIRVAFGEAAPIVPPANAAHDTSGAGLFDAEALLVEDNLINQQVAVELLGALGVRAQIAGSGEKALEILRHRTFDVILMDIQMPGMDGLTATAAIRGQLQIVDTPIIAMTANAMAGDRARCLAAGMNDHIAKPIDPDALARTLATWLKPASPRRRDKVDSAPLAIDPAEASTLPHFDCVTALRNVNGNRALLTRLLAEFVHEHGDDAAKIQAAVDRKDWSTARRLAHTLKGVALTLGASAVARPAAELESRASPAGTEAAADQIAAAIASLVVAISEAKAEVEALPAVVPPADRIVDVDRTSRPTLGLLLPIVDALSAKLADGDAEAETESAKLTEMLTGTDVGAIAEEVARLTGRFDFKDAIRVLSELRAKLTSEVQNVVH